MKKASKRIEGIEVQALYKCPCCDEKMMKKIFVKFDDPCICKSGNKFKDCCYKTGGPKIK